MYTKHDVPDSLAVATNHGMWRARDCAWGQIMPCATNLILCKYKRIMDYAFEGSDVLIFSNGYADLWIMYFVHDVHDLSHMVTNHGMCRGKEIMELGDKLYHMQQILLY